MKRIVIAQRGWVFVGDVAIDGDEVSITNASCIRRWGTTKGLGELAERGPLAETVLDHCPPVHMHILAVVAMMDCEAASWSAR